MTFLNHIGIATQDPEKFTRLFQILKILPVGAKIHTEHVPEQKVDTHFLPMPMQGHVPQAELLIPTADGAIQKFLDSKGPGIHHLSFQLEKGTLESISQDLVAAGYQLIYPAPQKGAHQMRINFIHPRSTGGILVEIMEPAGESHSL